MTTIPRCPLGELFDQIVHTLPATLRPATIEHYRYCANWFVRYIHGNYPELRTFAELQRNPHILGWLQSLSEKSPPFTIGTRLQIVTGVRHLLKNLADNGHPVAQNLILPRDTQRYDLYPAKPVCPEVVNRLARLLKQQLHNLSATLRPSTLAYYRIHPMSSCAISTATTPNSRRPTSLSAIRISSPGSEVLRKEIRRWPTAHACR